MAEWMADTFADLAAVKYRFGAAWDAAAGVASDRLWLTLADLISSDWSSS